MTKVVVYSFEEAVKVMETFEKAGAYYKVTRKKYNRTKYRYNFHYVIEETDGEGNVLNGEQAST